MKTLNKHTILLAATLLFGAIACEDKIDPLIKELTLDRALAPIELDARIRNMTTVELSWAVRSDADAYVVEISEGNLTFTSIVHSATILPGEVPYRVALDGETQYSARVKAINDNTGDSRWTTVVFQTDIENLFTPVSSEDLTATTATLKWVAGSDVTHFFITPGDVERTISPEEKTAGEATIEGLFGNTDYTVRLMKDQKQRGSVTFTTLIDVGNATVVYPEDDLSVVVAAASPGDVLVLLAGDYQVYKGIITIDKSISIRGYLPHDKPKIHVEFILVDGVQSVQVKDVEMDGESTIGNAFTYTTSGTAYGTLTVESCYIHHYTKSLFAGTSMASTIQSLNLDNSLVYDIESSGGDFIDFRVGYVANVNLTRSTFKNCSPARDFVRLDNSSAAFPGLVSNVLIENCTFYGVSNGNNRRYLYVRFVENILTVKNTLIAATAGIYTNQSLSSQPVCAKNNYFNAPGFHTADYVASLKIDQSSTFTTLDPGFVDAANNNFKVTNQALIDNNVGDPRWLQ
jgi:hypothetical protein